MAPLPSSSAAACRSRPAPPPAPTTISLALQRLGASAAAALVLLAAPATPALAAAAAPVPASTPTAEILADAPCDLVPVLTTLDASPMLACDLHVGDGPEPLRNALSRVHFVIALGDRREATAASSSSSSSAPPLAPIAGYHPPNPYFYTSRTKAGLGGGKPLLVKLGERDGVAAWDDAVLGGGQVLGGGDAATTLLPPMREGGVRRVVVPPGQLQRVNAKAMLWQAAELDALDEVGEAARAGGEEAAGAGGGATGFRRDLVFTLELSVAKKRS
jgi:hypothetical protein